MRREVEGFEEVLELLENSIVNGNRHVTILIIFLGKGVSIMKRIINLFFCMSFCLAVSFLTNLGVTFASQNIEDDCLACHFEGSTIVPNAKQFENGTSWHDFHRGYSCTLCHPGSPGATPIPVASCGGCHNTTCAWHDFHENNQTYLDNSVGFTCYQCHTDCEPLSGDSDGDGVPDDADNCPADHNAGQEDSFPPQGNGCGDACDCEGNFDGDEDVDGDDAFTFKDDFGRSLFQIPCESGNPCSGDFTCDGDVDGDDAFTFKEDFGRSSFNNPCPACEVGGWCSY